MKKMSYDQAEIHALTSFSFLMSESDLRTRFLALSGLEAPDLAGRLQDGAFLAEIIGFFLQHEKDLLALSKALDCAPSDHQAAYFALTGMPLEA